MSQRAVRPRHGGVSLLGLLRPHSKTLLGAAVLLVAQNTASVATPYLVKVGIDQGIPPLTQPDPDSRVLALVAVLIAMATVVEYLSTRGFQLLYGSLGQEVLFQCRTRLFEHFHLLPIGFHDTYSAGQMVSRLTSDMDSIEELAEGGLDDLIVILLSIVSMAGMLLWLDPPLALVVLAAFPPLMALARWYKTRSVQAYRRTRQAIAAVISWFGETLDGIRAVQAFQTADHNAKTLAALDEAYRVANLRALRLIAILAPGTKLIGNTALAIVLVFGGYRVVSGQLEIGVLAAFLLYVRKMFDPMQELSQFYNSLQSAAAGLERVSEVLDTPTTATTEARRLPREQVRGELRLDRLRFGYRPGRPVLNDLDLVIPAGQSVAIVGATGAGKSTIARLMARFYEPEAGSVYLDGIDLWHLPEADLRRSVLLIPQENLVFEGTVEDNIALGRPGATLERVIRAATATGAASFIGSLPEGYQTAIGEQGSLLSAGQRQLLALTRAFLADPAVLILDEASSALDIPSERLAQHALRKILANRTTVVIAHRLSTVEFVDRILVVEAGQIVEDGSPGALLASGGRYASLRRRWHANLVGKPM